MSLSLLRIKRHIKSDIYFCICIIMTLYLMFNLATYDTSYSPIRDWSKKKVYLDEAAKRAYHKGRNELVYSDYKSDFKENTIHSAVQDTMFEKLNSDHMKSKYTHLEDFEAFKHLTLAQQINRQYEMVRSYKDTNDLHSYSPLTSRDVAVNKSNSHNAQLTKMIPHNIRCSNQNSTNFVIRNKYSTIFIDSEKCDKSIVHKSSKQLKEKYFNVRKPIPKRGQEIYRLLRWDKPNNKSRTLGNSWFQSVDGTSTFQQCAYSNCEITTNRSDYNTSHAVLVHMWLTKLHFTKTIPNYRPEGQKWIMFVGEAPGMATHAQGARGDYSKFNNIFNTTWAYHRKADIWTDYGAGYFQKRRVPLLNSINYAWGKTRFAAWFSTNCHAVTSKRLEYVFSLKEYINIDIYGFCGTFICPRDNEKACLKTLHLKYKFYLAFENALCGDYITEKLWKIVPHINIIPVVMGAGNYSEVLPPGSYIDIADFNSTKELAEFMLRIDQDDSLFNSFFEYRKHYDYKYFESPFCQVCRYMNENHNVRKIYDRMGSFWKQETDCTVPETFFPHVHTSVWSTELCRDISSKSILDMDIEPDNISPGIKDLCKRKIEQFEKEARRKYGTDIQLLYRPKKASKGTVILLCIVGLMFLLLILSMLCVFKIVNYRRMFNCAQIKVKTLYNYSNLPNGV